MVIGHTLEANVSLDRILLLIGRLEVLGDYMFNPLSAIIPTSLAPDMPIPTHLDFGSSNVEETSQVIVVDLRLANSDCPE